MAGSTGKRVAGVVLFLLALVVAGVFVFYLYAEAEDLNISGAGEIPGIALGVLIFLALVSVTLLVLIMLRRADKKQPEAAAESYYMPPKEVKKKKEQPEEALPGGAEMVFLDEDAIADSPHFAGDDDVVPHDLRGVPLGARQWHQDDGEATLFSYHYPRFARRAVYANDYVPIDTSGRRLKLRTLLAAPPGAFAGAVEERPRPSPQPATEDLPSDDFMTQLEQRMKAQEKEPEPAPKPRSEAYYDYPGDNHDVIDVEGIGPVYAQKLNEMGVESTARLCYEDAGKISEQLDVPQKTVVTWQASAELMKVSGIGKQYAEALARAGITGIEELKKRSAQVIADQVNDYLDGLDQNVLGQAITSRRVEAWQSAAASMRRVRMRVPEA